MTILRSGSATDIGRNPRRPINQDMVLESDGIFAVADGMGGHLGGEVASLTAIEALRRSFAPGEGAEGLERAIEAANQAVLSESATSEDLKGMGTTLAVVALVDGDADELLAVANIGDSRIYLMRNGELSQLTDDHSLPEELFRRGQLTREEATADPRRNIVTRVLGPSYGEGPDIQNLVPYVGDRVLICSDGLYNEVDDAGIAKVLRTVGDPSQAARTLVDEANAHGGADNISVVIVDVVDDDGKAETASAVLADEPPRPRREGGDTSSLMTADERNAQLRRLAREPRPSGELWEDDSEVHFTEPPTRRLTARVLAFVVVLVVVLAGAGAAIGFYARGSYFVGLDEGRVAIFKGRPGGLLWFGPTIEQRTPLTLASLPPARVDDVASGHVVASIDEARAYVRALSATPGARTPEQPAATTSTAPAVTVPADADADATTSTP